MTVKKSKAKSRNRARGFRIVALGGGTGLSALLRGLKEHVGRREDQHVRTDRPVSDLAAIVTVTDDGGSSGRLRRENRILPPGDIRNCMVALSKDEALLGRLFQYRFHAGRGLIGHNFGNLFLAALTHITGDFTEAIRESSKVLAIRGRIFPSTLSNVHLVATLKNGRRKADLILLGPGSLYTSVLPNLLIPEVANAIARSKAPRVYIANLMTQPGETAGYALADHVGAIQAHATRNLVDFVVANQQPVSPKVARRYRAQGAEPVIIDLKELNKLGCQVILDNLLDERDVIRHDHRRLARLLLDKFAPGNS